MLTSKRTPTKLKSKFAVVSGFCHLTTHASSSSRATVKFAEQRFTDFHKTVQILHHLDY